MFGGLFKKIKQVLSKTFSGVAELFRFKGRVDKEFLLELEKRLYLADVGTFATQEIVNRVASFRHGPPADDMSLVAVEIP